MLNPFTKMEKEKLELILKSDIIKSEKVMEDFEYTFLDVKQVLKRIKWFNEYLDNPIGYFKDFSKELIHFWDFVGERPEIMIIEETKIWKEEFNVWLLNKAFEEILKTKGVQHKKQ